MNASSQSLLLHNDYHNVHCAVVSAGEINTIEAIASQQAASQLIPTIARVCEQSGTSLSECDYITAHRGPAPFTTLRTVISTANGLCYASHLPLIGVDGIYALASHMYHSTCDHALVLLHAFKRDVYYGLYDRDMQAQLYGWAPFATFQEKLHAYISNCTMRPRILCAGNGVMQHYQDIVTDSQYDSIMTDPYIYCATPEHIASRAEDKWQEDETSTMLTPLYLKQRHAYVHL